MGKNDGHCILAPEIHKGIFPPLGTNSTYTMWSFQKKLIAIRYNCVWRFGLYLVKLHLNTVKLGMVVHVCNPST